MTQIKIQARPISENVEGKIEGAMHSAAAKSSGIWKGGIRVKPINKQCDRLIVTRNTFYSRAAHITREESEAELRTQADAGCELQNPSYIIHRTAWSPQTRQAFGSRSKCFYF